MNKAKKKSKEDTAEEPQRNKILLYLAFALTAIGAVMALVPTIIVFMPNYNLEWSTLFYDPLTYVLIAGIVLVTVGLIMQRVITPPMKISETEKLRSRLE